MSLLLTASQTVGPFVSLSFENGCVDNLAAAGVSGATLIETAPLRLIPGTLRRMGVSEDIRNYINSYDAIVVLKGAKAATPFARPLPAFFAER